MLYANQNQLDKARTALEMAIRTNPSYATAHENLGDIYAKLASQAYNKALQLDATSANSVKPKLALIRELFSARRSQQIQAALRQRPLQRRLPWWPRSAQRLRLPQQRLHPQPLHPGPGSQRQSPHLRPVQLLPRRLLAPKPPHAAPAATSGSSQRRIAAVQAVTARPCRLGPPPGPPRT